MKDEIRKEDLVTCPTCGHPAAVVEGRTTKYYLHVQDEVVERLNREGGASGNGD